MPRRSLLLILAVLCAAHFALAQAPEDKARFAAEQWIVLVDDGQYDESWKEASKIFQDATSKDDWQKQADSSRAALGHRTSRKLKEIKTGSQGLKGLPFGQYIQVKYQSTYEKKKQVLETVVAILEADGNWRVAAYSVN